MDELPVPFGGGASKGARALAIVAAARQILQEQCREGLTMRRLSEAVGICAPSLYKHFPDKATVEVALIEEGIEQIAEAFERALSDCGESLASLATA